MQDLWAGHRALLNEGISRYLDEGTYTSGQLIREQVEASEPAAYETAALACLAAAEAVGASAKAALPGAVAIAFMSQMALVYMSLDNSGGAPSLSTAWGMPRALNAGDAMFALAQESLLSAEDELTAEVRLQAAALLDTGTRQLVDALFSHHDEDPLARGQKALLPSAMALGGLLGGADVAPREKLEELGRAWIRLSPEELTRMLASSPSTWLES